jgi:inorganic pyrophosphatase
VNTNTLSLLQLDALAISPGTVNVIIDTTKGSRNKYAYDSSRRVFFLKSLLPLGTVFPFDFGFIPSRLGGDGDPLDALVLMKEEAIVGCLIEVRLIGVIKAEQTKDGKTTRNDRRIIAAVHSLT